jgi:membrane dipeptidase
MAQGYNFFMSAEQKSQGKPQGEPAPFLLDCHVDTIIKVVDYGRDFIHGIPDGQVDLPRLHEAGVGVLFFACWVDPGYLPDRSFERANELIDGVEGLVASHSDKISLVRTMQEARDTQASGKLAVVLGVEGGHAIEEDLGKLRHLADRGVRYMTLTWNNHLSWAESCQKPTEISPRGLSDFGREVVNTMARLGVVADLAHVSPQTFEDVLVMDVPPPIDSHTAARSLCDHCRNLSDSQIEALAARGGALGLTLVPGFLADQSELADIDLAVTHALHILSVGGTQVLGLGSDYDGIDRAPLGLEDCAKLSPLATRIREAAELSPEEFRGFSHQNLMRVFEAWEA